MRAGSKKAKVWIVVLIILGVAALGTMIAFFVDAPVRHELQAISIGNVDFTKLQDGTYIGEYNGMKGNSRDAAVEVTIWGGKITEIRILKGALDKSGGPARLTEGMTIEDLFQSVIKSQSLQVDTISGATLTAKAHLKALENALKQSQE